MTRILQLNNLTKVFSGNVTAVNDVSMSVEEGEFITLLGPSGCGKTTMLRMIGGFEYPDSGAVFLDGTDITDTPPYERPVNMMFQDFALFPHMSVAGNIGYGLKISGVKGRNVQRQVGEMLDLIDLPGMENRLPSELLHLPGLLSENRESCCWMSPCQHLTPSFASRCRLSYWSCTRKSVSPLSW